MNNDKNAKLSQQILIFYLWQIIDVTWIIIMKFSVLKDDLIVNDMKLEKMITVLTSVVLMIKLRVRNNLNDFHKLILIMIFLITIKVWKVEIQQYFLKLMIQYFMNSFEKNFIEKKNHMLNVSCNDLKDFIDSLDADNLITTIIIILTLYNTWLTKTLYVKEKTTDLTFKKKI